MQIATATSISYDLRWLIDPIDSDFFLKTHWTKTPLRISRQASVFYGPLFDEDDIEYVLQAASSVPGALEELTEDEHPRRSRDLISAQEAFRRGRSLRVDAAHRFSKKLNSLCRSLEQTFSCPVNINMYLSFGAKRALARHYDTHDVFALQVYGKKKWRIYNSSVDFPLEYLPPLRCERDEAARYRMQKRKDPNHPQGNEVVDEFTLARGDLLYLPRGYWHEAETEPGMISCHLTIGPLAFTYVDLLTIAVTQLATRNADLRKPLPIGFATHSDCRTTVRTQMDRIMNALARELDSDAALSEVSETFLRSRPSVDKEALGLVNESDIEDIQPGSLVGLRAGVICSLTTGESCVVVAFGLRTVSLPLAFEDALRFIASAMPFTAAQLPGAITDAERLSLVQRLIADGLLSRLD